MANRLYNKQVSQPVSQGSKAKNYASQGQPMGATQNDHKDPWPGLPGPTKKWPANHGDAKVCQVYPIAEGLDG